MSSTDYYPALHEVLKTMGEDAILVGSATIKALDQCKDYDFVISDVGMVKLKVFEYYLYREGRTWWQYIPLSSKEKAADFFNGICDISDTSKFDKRLTYADACKLDLKIKIIEGIEVLSI